MTHREIFTPKYLREKRNIFSLENPKEVSNLAAIRQHVADWQTSFYNKTILRQSEIQLQKEFLSTFFAGCLGFKTKIGRNNWELDYESTTDLDATRADGYLGFFSPTARKIVAVIELKDANCDLDRPQNRKNDKRTPVEQAFSYASKVGADCRWVIVSNFLEIRLYHAADQGRFEYFHITQLHLDEQLWRFLFLLHRDRLLPHGSESFLEHFHRERLEQEQTISIDFYKKFKAHRQTLFQHLKKNNPTKPELLLFEKTQKLLDRLIFVFFCEDKGLLPFDISRKVQQAARASLDPTGGQNIWAQLRGLFRSIDKGNPPQNINRYNGGLFAHDPELDDLAITDNMAEILLGLAGYDFDSDLNVNILGHIFEQSISDIEEIKSEIAGNNLDKKQGKRKKDGIFYTPEYITRYIVRQAVGGWLDDRKREIGFDDLPELTEKDFASIKMMQTGPRKGLVEGNAAIEKHRAAWTNYRDRLAKIKVLDPACGSGAFLIQVFDFLRLEQQAVNDEIARLSLGLRSTDDLARQILTQNIFGVDINQESVEITKLSLWLKTADNQSELTALDQNIRCGNSLIDDAAVAGDLAFDWQVEFSTIFEENGGFDVVVGNPPYVPATSISQPEKAFFISKYETSDYQLNTYGLFVERCFSWLNEASFYSFIIPNYWLSTKYDERLRQIVFLKNHCLEILNTFQVFKDATVDTLILTGRKTSKILFPKTTAIKSIDSKLGSIEDRLAAIGNLDFKIDKKLVLQNEENLPTISFSEGKNELIGQEKLGDYFSFNFGMKPYQEGKGKPKQTREMMNNKIFHSTNKIDETYFPLLTATSVKRYRIVWEGNFIKYGIHLAEPRKKEIFENPRILLNRILSGKKMDAVFVEEKFINNSDVFNLIPKSTTDLQKTKALFAIIASSLCADYFKRKNVNLQRDAFPKLNTGTLETFPVPEISADLENQLASLADQMLALHQSLQVLKTRFLQLIQSEMGIEKPSRALENWEMLDFKSFSAELAKQKVVLSLGQKSEWLSHFETERSRAQKIHDEIRATDEKIDGLVFDLYELTGEERAMVLGK